MTRAELAIAFAAVALMATILAGLFVRRRHRLCYSFATYVAAVLLGDALVLARPSVFWTWEFWVFKETIYVLLKLFVALELTALIFAAFPAAAATARAVMLLTLLATLGGIVLGGIRGADLGEVAYELQPRVTNGSAGLLILIWTLAVWYRIPVHPLHRALFRGFIAYLLTATLCYHVLSGLGWKLAVGYVTTTVYTLVLAYWARAVWRPEETAPVSPETLRRLQPWRDRL